MGTCDSDLAKMRPRSYKQSMTYANAQWGTVSNQSIHPTIPLHKRFNTIIKESRELFGDELERQLEPLLETISESTIKHYKKYLRGVKLRAMKMKIRRIIKTLKTAVHENYAAEEMSMSEEFKIERHLVENLILVLAKEIKASKGETSCLKRAERQLLGNKSSHLMIKP